MRAQLIQLSGDDSFDLVSWRIYATFEESREKESTSPGIQAYAENIVEILADETGEMVDVEQVIGAHPKVSQAPTGEAGSSLSHEECR